MGFHVSDLPIGVFDSGVGGLTVLAALRRRMPQESFVYLGDTARLPYGTKSPGTVQRYAEQAARVLVDHGIKLLVIACNTASAVAVETLSAAFAPLPVLGVVEPGAAAACEASRGGRIVVIGTEGTIRGGAYDRAIARLRPDARVVGRACPLFVSLAEEGWTEGPIPRAVAERYLAELVGPESDADCLVLGCTHFPVLASVLAEVAAPTVRIVDSAETTAAEVARRLGGTARSHQAEGPGALELWATDDPQRFARVGGRFLAVELQPGEVRVVDL